MQSKHGKRLWRGDAGQRDAGRTGLLRIDCANQSLRKYNRLEKHRGERHFIFCYFFWRQ
jgi:hypothetical protein